MEFDLVWTLEDAKYITQDTYDMLTEDPDNPELQKILWKQGEMFTKSLNVINEHCKNQLIQYRMTLASHSSEENQEKALDELYATYKTNMTKKPYGRVFQSIVGFFKKVID